MNNVIYCNSEEKTTVNDDEDIVGKLTDEITKEIDRKQTKKIYKCKSSTKSSTSFNRKLARKYVGNNKNNIKTDNRFYINHYSSKTNNNLYIESLRKNTTPIISKFNNKLNPGGINNSEFSSTSQDSVKFCLNCGNYGHTKGRCSEPNIANGVVAVRYNTERQLYEYLIVMRKHSHGYCDIIRGNYPDNYQHIKTLFEETTTEERNYILNNDFNDNWIYLWGKDSSILAKFKNTSINEKKFNAFKNNYLDKLLKDATTNWLEPEWGFPKGQRDGFEKNIETAFREFSEESGYSQDKCICVSNLMPFKEIFIGSNKKKYKQMYYLAFMDYEETSDNKIMFQKTEIGNALWVSIQELLSKFRYYDTEKIKIAMSVNNILKNCSFVYI
jgi:8-oxo-dGTP pyrophosphatase MutT (NUDIX family)